MVERKASWTIAAVAVILAVGAAGPIRTPISVVTAVAQTAPAALSEAQAVNGQPGVVAEIVQCKRESGVLSIRMRLRNTGETKANVHLISSRNYDQYYVTAGNKKYFILRDSEKNPLTTQAGGLGDLSAEMPKDGSYVWYAKYPAPPGEAKKVTFYTPITPPFEDIPIFD
jgi:hypothetical protein